MQSFARNRLSDEVMGLLGQYQIGTRPVHNYDEEGDPITAAVYQPGYGPEFLSQILNPNRSSASGSAHALTPEMAALLRQAYDNIADQPFGDYGDTVKDLMGSHVESVLANGGVPGFSSLKPFTPSSSTSPAPAVADVGTQGSNLPLPEQGQVGAPPVEAGGAATNIVQDSSMLPGQGGAPPIAGVSLSGRALPPVRPSLGALVNGPNPPSLDELKNMFTGEELAQLDQGTLEQFSNDDLMAIGQASGDPQTFFSGFRAERMNQFPEGFGGMIANMQPLVSPSGSVVSSSVTKPTTVGGVTYVPPALGQTEPTSSNTGPSGAYPGGVVKADVINPTLPGGPQGPVPRDVFKGGDAANGPVTGGAKGAPPVGAGMPMGGGGYDIPLVGAGTPMGGYGIPVLSSNWAKYQGMLPANLRSGAAPSVSAASGRLMGSAVGMLDGEGGEPARPNEDGLATEEELLAHGYVKEAHAGGKTYWRGPDNRMYDPETGDQEETPGAWAAKPTGTGPGTTPPGPQPGPDPWAGQPDKIPGYVRGSKWDPMANRGQGGLVPTWMPDPSYTDPSEQAKIDRARSAGTTIHVNPATDPARAGLLDAQTQNELNKAAAGLQDAQAALVRAQASRIPADIASAQADLDEKKRQFDITTQNAQAQRAQTGAISAAERAQRAAEFGVTQTGYYGGTPTLAREQLLSQEDRANFEAAARAGDMSAARALQLDDQKQRKIEEDRQFGLRSGEALGSYGGNETLAARTQRQNYELQAAQQKFQQDRDPFSATAKAAMLRGGGETPGPVQDIGGADVIGGRLFGAPPVQGLPMPEPGKWPPTRSTYNEPGGFTGSAGVGHAVRPPGLLEAYNEPGGFTGSAGGGLPGGYAGGADHPNSGDWRASSTRVPAYQEGPVGETIQPGLPGMPGMRSKPPQPRSTYSERGGYAGGADHPILNLFKDSRVTSEPGSLDFKVSPASPQRQRVSGAPPVSRAFDTRGMAPGLASVYGGTPTATARSPLPWLSAQKEASLMPSERKIVGAEAQSRGIDPEDYFHQSRQLSQTGATPRVTTRTIPQRYY